MKIGYYKKSQIAVFIIISVLLISLIAIIFLSSSKKLSKEEFLRRGLEPSLKNIQDFIIDCLEETSKDSLEIIGIQGGYYNKPKYYYDLEWTFIPYYYHKGEFLMPKKESVEKEISSYIDSSISFCLDEIDFKNFKISYQDPKTNSRIQKSKVEFTTDLLFSIEHKEETTSFELNKHTFTTNSSLNEMLELAEYITESHKENKELMCINCITEMAKDRNLFIDFIAFETDSTLVMLIENITAPEPYLFEFLNKYENIKPSEEAVQ